MACMWPASLYPSFLLCFISLQSLLSSLSLGGLGLLPSFNLTPLSLCLWLSHQYLYPFLSIFSWSWSPPNRSLSVSPLPNHVCFSSSVALYSLSLSLSCQSLPFPFSIPFSLAGLSFSNLYHSFFLFSFPQYLFSFHKAIMCTWRSGKSNDQVEHTWLSMWVCKKKWKEQFSLFKNGMKIIPTILQNGGLGKWH